MNQDVYFGLKNAYDAYADDIVRRFHVSLDVAIEKIENCSIHPSGRNSPQDNALRTLLLEIHNDSRIADFLNYKSILSFHTRNHGSAADPITTGLGFLSRNGKVNYHVYGLYGPCDYGDYCRAEGDKKLKLEQDSLFLLEDGRFYNRNGRLTPHSKIELIDLFPGLTLEELDLSFNELIEKEKNRRIEKKQNR